VGTHDRNLSEGRETLKAVVLILDIRRNPGIEEQNFIDWLKLYHRSPSWC
jgi:GTP-binding protein